MNQTNLTFTNTSIHNFIECIIKYDNVNEILNICKQQSDKGYVYERLWDIVIKFGYCECFPNSQFTHKIGNSNNANLKDLTDINEYVKGTVYSGNSGGYSDITLFDNATDTYIFITSKYPKTSDDIKKQKSVDYYDIQKIITMINKHKHIFQKFKIYLLVPDKYMLLNKVKLSNKSSNCITDYIKYDNVLDKHDLNKLFLLFKRDMIKYMTLHTKINFNELYLHQKDNLKLRFHQEVITQKTSNLIEEGNMSFLWGCKCRSGKTYMVGGIVLKQYDIHNKLNVLIITPVPTETMPQFTEELFNKFQNFNNFTIHHIKGSKSIQNLELGDNNIFVMSKQLLQKYTNDNVIIKIKKLNLNIIIFDENHFSGTTDLSKEILTSYSSKNTVKIYLTATYNKPLKEWNINGDCQMYWDIEDEQICKSILKEKENVIKLKEKHGDMIDTTIKYFNDLGYSINDIFSPYLNMPDLHLITNMFDSQRYEIIKENIMNSKYGFSFDVLFSLKSANKNIPEFNYRNEVKTILRYISGSTKELDFKNGDKSIFTRINNICTRPPFIQIWFLPSDNINNISQCLIKLLSEDEILNKYDVMCINRKNDKLAKDVKDEITKQEIKSRALGKRGIILLAGNMLSLGITINSCDVVILMNNSLSSDKVLQQMYRCMTEGENKKVGMVVDLNISRVLNTCVNYTIYKNDLSVEDKIKYLIENNLINIDADMMINKKIDSDYIIKKLMDIWKGDPVNSFKTLLTNLDSDYIVFDNPTQKLINNFFTSSTKTKNVNAFIEIKNEGDDTQELPSGKSKCKEDESVDQENNDEENETQKEPCISFTKDVLPYIIPLICILTMKNKNMDFVKMLVDIKNNNELLDIFDNQCLIWWNKKDLIDTIKNIIDKYFGKSSNPYNISIQFKMSLHSLIDNPKELLELINDCLKPKEIEKQQFGEVYTPITIIEEMLDNLDNDYIKNNKVSIFTNPNLKWFDPAVGMGNFMVVVYLRLIKNLTTIEDEKLRKKHILENMLYMSEINQKNVLILKQIFDINDNYKLNINNGDTLNLNVTTLWNIKNFDVIVGNPPYNLGGIKSHTSKKLGETNITIWPKFIDYSIKFLKINGYLAFINPLSWLKFSHNTHDMLLKYHITWLKLWDNSKSKQMINADIPISIYVLHKIINNNNNPTEIISQLKRRNLETKSLSYLDKNYTIPLAFHSIFEKIINKIKQNNLKLEYSSKTTKSLDKLSYKLPEKYSSNDMLGVDTYRIKDGYFVKKMIELHPDTTKTKLIIANKASLKGSLIDDGKLGLIGNHKFYILGDDLTKIQTLFETSIVDIISHFTKYGQDFLDKDCFTYIPDVRKIPTDQLKEINDENLYAYFDFTKDEILLLENMNDKPKDDKPKDVKVINKQKLKNNHYILKDICESIEIGINMETFSNTKTKKCKGVYYTKEKPIFCDGVTYDGKYILCVRSPVNQGMYHITDGEFSASKDIILIKLKTEFNNNFDEIFEYIQNNFDHEILIKENPVMVKINNILSKSKFIGKSHFEKFIIELK